MTITGSVGKVRPPRSSQSRSTGLEHCSLLGLVKHLSMVESRYFGEVFDRPFAVPLPRWNDAEEHGADMWATEHGTRAEVVGRYRRAWEHSDATITALAIDSPGHVPWWPRRDVKLFNVLVHALTETSRHAGHADIMREQLDKSTGTTAQHAASHRDGNFREARWAKIERAARTTVTEPDHAGPYSTFT
ncbi:DinB family protein [Streptomyces cyaneofuscatus]|uniref:DinB family protein n=1 Tax=Streptomyces cyaneofuscatus TaxID=66883 RepID=UPI0037CE70D1